jgi:retinaldehyde-binding protein 1
MANLFDIDTSPESAELLAIAEKELRETPEVRAKGIAELRDLLKKNPDLVYTDDEDYLVIILRVCHWYPESALKLVMSKREREGTYLMKFQRLCTIGDFLSLSSHFFRTTR